MKQPSHVPVMTCLTTLALAGWAVAGSTTSTTIDSGKSPVKDSPAAAEPNPLAKIWDCFSLYKSETGFLNELAITGRYQGQYHWADGTDGDEDDWDNRRFRIGAKAVLLEKRLELKAEIFSDLNSGGDFYEGFTELYAGLKLTDDLTLTVGKQKTKFGQDWTLSSRLSPTFERSLLTNSYKPNYAPGVTLAGKSGTVSYYLGAFSNEVDEVFGQFEGGFSYIATVNFDVKETFGTDKASLGVGYTHSTHEAVDAIFKPYDNHVSLNLELKDGKFGLYSEVLALFGDNENYGFSVTPTYDITDKLQFVARYQFAASADNNGISPQSRYEAPVSPGKGDTYNAIYAGMNYFVYEHKFKIMAGVEYANLDGDDTVTALTGVRLYW